MEKQFNRLFFGIEVNAPWPENLPSGKLIQENQRHLTLAFLGNEDPKKLLTLLEDFSPISFQVGLVGKFDQCNFFPSSYKPRCVAWHARILNNPSLLIELQKTLVFWLQQHEFHPDCRHGFLPHVTIARAPFDLEEWKNSFSPIPFNFKDLHLYKSLGNSQYEPIWTHALLPPFEEIEHTADKAFDIRGGDYNQLYLHACVALSFSFIPFLDFIATDINCQSILEVIHALNEMITLADGNIGCPFKAVSYHTNLKQQDEIFVWEMIVDV